MMIPTHVVTALQSAWADASAFANSAFASAFLSALAGAGLGVWGAQVVAERGLRRRELLDALRQSNAVMVLATTIVNQTLSLKRQYVSPLSARYFKDRDTAIEHHKKVICGLNPALTTFEAEMTRVSPLTIPLDALKNLVYSAQLMTGRALALVAMVEQFAEELRHTIVVRNELIESFKTAALPSDIFCLDYYGIERRDGNTNTMYHDSMLAMTQYTDDVAFFASELAEEMQSHGATMREKLIKLHKDAPKVSSVDFSSARDSGLIPPKSSYESWLSGFRKQ